MSTSILTSTKKILGIAENYTAFDLDIITHINSVFTTLQQLGVGPSQGFMIEGSSETWNTFIVDDLRLNAVKTYMYMRVRLMFDPPATSFAISSMQEQVKELEWRLNVQVDPGPNYVIPPRLNAEESYDPFLADVDVVVVEPT